MSLPHLLLPLLLLPMAAYAAAAQARPEEPLTLTCQMEWSTAALAPVDSRGAPALARLLAHRVQGDCFDQCAKSAAERLVELGAEAAPALIELLSLPDGEDCGLAIWALSGIGETAVEPLMAAVLSAARPATARRAAALALMEIVEQQRWKELRTIPPPPSLQQAIELLGSPEEAIREAGASTLIAFGGTAVVLNRLRGQLESTASPAIPCCDAALIRPLIELCRELPPLPLEHLETARKLFGVILARENVTETGRAAAEEAVAVFDAVCKAR